MNIENFDDIESDLEEECFQCVIDEVDTKLEDLLNLVNSTRHWSPYKIENLKDQLVAIRDEIRPLVSC